MISMVMVSHTFIYVVCFIAGIIFTIVSLIAYVIHCVKKDAKLRQEQLEMWKQSIAFNKKDEDE